LVRNRYRPSRRRIVRNFLRLSAKVKLGRSLSTSISTRRQAAGALVRAPPSFISSSSREISMAAICRSRFHSHFNCRRRIARSLVTRS